MFREAAYNAMMAELAGSGDDDGNQKVAEVFADFYVHEHGGVTGDVVRQLANAAGIAPEDMVASSIGMCIRFFLAGISVGYFGDCSQ